MDYTPQEYETFKDMYYLYMKTNDIDAFSYGFYSNFLLTSPFVYGGLLDQLTGYRDDGTHKREYQQATVEQNKISYIAGSLLGGAFSFKLGASVMKKIPGLGNVLAKAGEKLSHIPVIGALGADSLTNILADTTLDTAIDTIPSMVGMAIDGESGSEIAKEGLKKTGISLGVNGAYEVAFKAGKVAIEKLFDTKLVKVDVETYQERTDFVDSTDNAVETSIKSTKELLQNPPKEILSDVELKDISEKALEKCEDAGLSNIEVENLRRIQNTKKPEPKSYLDNSYIDTHLQKF